MKKVVILVNKANTTIIFIIFCDFLMFYQIFFSPQVKQRCTIISNKQVALQDAKRPKT